MRLAASRTNSTTSKGSSSSIFNLSRLYTINARSMLTCDSLYTLARGLPQAILIINPIAYDGNCGQALCVHNNLIYDSAEERAMPLEQQWLDRCVRVDSGRAMFQALPSLEGRALSAPAVGGEHVGARA